MVKLNENAIKEAAYFMWESAGRPQGQDDYFWMMAVEQSSNSCKSSSCKSSSLASSAKKSTSTAKKTTSSAACKSTSSAKKSAK